jgi:hypothetical protein
MDRMPENHGKNRQLCNILNYPPNEHIFFLVHLLSSSYTTEVLNKIKSYIYYKSDHQI